MPRLARKALSSASVFGIGPHFIPAGHAVYGQWCPLGKAVLEPYGKPKRRKAMPMALESWPKKARHFPVAIAALFSHIGAACGRGRVSGCSSGVEHNLAKVGVGRSNRLTRSKSSQI